MKTEKLNEYIKHYLEEDRTKSAIMLDAPWGTGKSHYIQNDLIPYLIENGDHKCVVVSLYGLTDLSEISKTIYLEIRTESIKEKLKPLNGKTYQKIIKNRYVGETLAATKSIGKFLIKGLAGNAGFDLNVSNEELVELYNSIDLTGKLIVFEDIERSNIKLLDFMGYVNNLVEQEGVKALLVANEDAIKQYNSVSDKNDEGRYGDLLENKSNYSEETKKYFKIKEKTISDTVKFENDYFAAIESIIKSFENEMLNQYLNDETVKEILDLFKEYKINNLRTFTFACQKTVDIYKYIGTEYSSEFIKSVFYGNIIFSNRLKTGKDTSWDVNNVYSLRLGDSRYPMYKFSYDYIMEQSFDFSDINLYEKEFEKVKLYSKNKSEDDSDLKELYSSEIGKEKDVRKAIDNIGNRLMNVEDISFYEYGKIANSLILTSTFLDLDLNKHKELLINNLYGRGDEVNGHSLFHFIIEISDMEKKKEFQELKTAMLKSLKKYDNGYYGFDYKLESISAFLDNIFKKRGEILNDKSFATNINMEKFSELMLQCSAENINEIRMIFAKVYEPSNIKNFLSDDKISIDSLLEKIKSLKNNTKFDRIQQMQLNKLIVLLEGISEKLN